MSESLTEIVKLRWEELLQRDREYESDRKAWLEEVAKPKVDEHLKLWLTNMRHYISTQWNGHPTLEIKLPFTSVVSSDGRFRYKWDDVEQRIVELEPELDGLLKIADREFQGCRVIVNLDWLIHSGNKKVTGIVVD